MECNSKQGAGSAPDALLEYGIIHNLSNFIASLTVAKMNIFRLLIVFTALTSHRVLAQGWENSFGDPELYVLTKIKDAGDSTYFVMGYSAPDTSATYWSALAMKIDLNGTAAWSLNPGVPEGNGSVQDVYKMKDNSGYLILVNIYRSGEYSSAVIKVDLTGNKIWSKHYDWSDLRSLRSVVETADGNLLFGALGNYEFEVHLIYSKPNGDVIWKRTHNCSGYLLGVGVSADGSYLARGTVGLSNGIYCTKRDTSGTIAWERQHFSGAKVYMNSFHSTSDGGSIIAAEEGHDITVFKIDSAGILQWKRTYGNADKESNPVAAQLSDGKYILSATRKLSSAGNKIIVLMKVNSIGTPMWERTHDHPEYQDLSASVVGTPDGGAIVTGGYDYNNSSFIKKGLIFRITSSGNVGIPEISTGNFHAYPQPFNNGVSIACSTTAAPQEIRVYDITGRDVTLLMGAIKIESRPADALITIERGSISPGIYFCTFPGDDGRMLTIKLIAE